MDEGNFRNLDAQLDKLDAVSKSSAAVFFRAVNLQLTSDTIKLR